MNQLLENFRRKWPTYLFEVLVLIIGIYGAFALERWNEERKERKIEREILEGCISGLTDDLADIEDNIRIHERSIKSMDKILVALENDQPYHDSLSYDFGYAMVYTFFVHSTSAFEALKSQGIEIIINKKILEKIIKVYDSNYDFFLDVELDLQKDVQYGYRHLFPGRFQETLKIDMGTSDFKNAIVPLDFEALKSDQEFLYYLKSLRNKSRFVLDFHYANLQENVFQLRSDLEEEINQRF